MMKAFQLKAIIRTLQLEGIAHLPFLQNKGIWLETWYSELLVELSCYLQLPGINL